MSLAPPAARRALAGRRVVAALLVLVVAAAAGVFAMVVRAGLARREARLALTPDAEVAGLRAAPFALTDQDGKPVTEASLQGRITVLDFFFTHCPFVCPMMGANMRNAQRALGADGVRFLSVSVDPAHDTPERLREYAASLGADTSIWTFATGDADAVRALSEGSFGLGLAPDPAREIRLPDGGVMPNIAHSSKFVLLGPDGEALAFHSGIEAEDVRRLVQRARFAARALRNRGAADPQHAQN